MFLCLEINWENNLENLLYFDVSDNDLTGTVSGEFHALDNLKGLSLQNNSIFGDLNFLCSKNFTSASGMDSFEYFEQTSYILPINLGLTVAEVSYDCCTCHLTKKILELHLIHLCCVCSTTSFFIASS